MEIKIKLNEDLDLQGLNVHLVRETRCKQDASFAEYQQKMHERIEKADAHWQRQLDVMQHMHCVLQRRMDAFKKRNPFF